MSCLSSRLQLFIFVLVCSQSCDAKFSGGSRRGVAALLGHWIQHGSVFNSRWPFFVDILLVPLALVSFCCCCAFGYGGGSVLVETIAEKCCGKDITQKLCYVCEEFVGAKAWRTGKHRTKCAAKNKQFLDTLAQPQEAHCEECGNKLFLFPRRKQGKRFKCSGPSCKTMTDIDNDGLIENDNSNRFNCFPCNFDLCLSCVTEQVESKASSETSPLLQDDLLRVAEGQTIFNGLPVIRHKEIDLETGRAVQENQGEGMVAQTTAILNKFQSKIFG